MLFSAFVKETSLCNIWRLLPKIIISLNAELSRSVTMDISTKHSHTKTQGTLLKWVVERFEEAKDQGVFFFFFVRSCLLAMSEATLSNLF